MEGNNVNEILERTIRDMEEELELFDDNKTWHISKMEGIEKAIDLLKRDGEKEADAIAALDEVYDQHLSKVEQCENHMMRLEDNIERYKKLLNA